MSERAGWDCICLGGFVLRPGRDGHPDGFRYLCPFNEAHADLARLTLAREKEAIHGR